MSELPAGWTHFALKDIGGLSGGKTPSKATPKFWSSPDVPWVSPKDMKRDLLSDSEDKISNEAVDQAGMTLYPANSVLMVTRSGILQHTFPVSMAGTALTVNQDIKVLRPIEGINPKYSFHLLKGFGSVILTRCSKAGTTVQSVDSEKLEALMLPLPPLAEQTRIAQKLDELLAQVDTLKTRIDAIPALLKRFRQSVLAAAVSGRLTEGWRTAHGIDEPQASWKAIELAEVSALVTSGSRGWAEYYASNGAIFIRSQDINTDELDTSDTAFVRLPESSEGKRTRVQPQDILITITGANVGKVARVKQALSEAYVSQHVALVRLQRPELAPFVELYLKDVGSGRKKLTELAYGGGKPGLNLSNIRDLAFALPCLEEQTEIVVRVEQLFAFAEQLEAKVAAAQTRIDHLTQSILAKAFRGELVPQDPNDEPASVLLERIQAQRAAAPKAKRGRKASA
ncbi:restriction endonuclease subunit S [Pseudomonas citronellolis]|uniref:restriction endonuclease subunit S n=1 Tax=Pseudomonas citronellolis TaxID=53408 RepID=UPI0023E376C4|nr:restriction endonuclease subunit S [Pseudomonas citronellolis]MDF3935514.1 restriction endonuclease subunit S [Pseudomonas citronellolis]